MKRVGVSTLLAGASAIAGVLSISAISGCGGGDTGGCQKDTDCKGTRVCVAGACVDSDDNDGDGGVTGGDGGAADRDGGAVLHDGSALGDACSIGAACIPADHPCNAGVFVCGSGGSVCVDTAMPAVDGTAFGTACGVGRACRSGTCQPWCNSGLDCLAGSSCRPADHQCVGCLADGQCGDGGTCALDAGVCRAPSLPQSITHKMDVLFMVDNSASMDAMQAELINRISQFFKTFDDLAAAGTYPDLHIGVVTSDYGAGDVGAPGCDPSPGGQRGALQAIGAVAANTCKKPTGNVNFIQYAYSANGNTNNLPAGQDLVATFTCMASVGHSGCGYEHQLESVYAALHPANIPANAGFLRADAILVVVFLTNEDDASAPPTTDIYDRMKTTQYGYESSYRQTNFAIVCGPSPGTALPTFASSNGPLDNCRPAPNPNNMGPGKTYDVSRYTDFFSQPTAAGGLKDNPNDVILVAIDAPETPFEVILASPNTPGTSDYVQCSPFNQNQVPSPCVPLLQHSCRNTTNAGFFGDPAVRMNAVVRSVPINSITSICEDDFTAALQNLGTLIKTRLQ